MGRLSIIVAEVARTRSFRSFDSAGRLATDLRKDNFNVVPRGDGQDQLPPIVEAGMKTKPTGWYLVSIVQTAF